MYDEKLLKKSLPKENTIISPTQKTNTKRAGFIGLIEASSNAYGVEEVGGYDYSTLSTEYQATTKETSDNCELEELTEAWEGSYDPIIRSRKVIGRDDRVAIEDTQQYPYRAICSLIITAPTGHRFIGSGWFVSSRTIITAAHCLYFHKYGGLATSIEVYPGRNGNQLPYGRGTATDIRCTADWMDHKEMAADYGAIILPANQPIGDQVGFFGYEVLGKRDTQRLTLNLSGYPADKRPLGQQWYHSRRTTKVDATSIQYRIDTYGGQSGAPVWYQDNGKRYVVGIHTYGGSSVNAATRITQEVFEKLEEWRLEGATTRQEEV